MSLWPVLSQKTYPGVGDLDECGMIATVWAAEASDPCLKRNRPTVKRFRWAAGDPDDGYRDGWTLSEIHRAVDVIYPTALNHKIQERSWDRMHDHLVAGHPVSIAVDSSYLPAELRYGFYRNHQLGGWRSPKTGYIYAMNPLAPEGSRPQRITESALKRAAMNLEGAGGWVLAECFTPIPVHLHYGGIRTTPFPDRTRIDSPTGRAAVYSNPTIPDRAHWATKPLPNGSLFTAYQRMRNTKGQLFFGDHRGTKWVNAARLDHKGGDS